MDKFKSSESIKEIISDIYNKKFNEVLLKIELLIKHYPNLSVLNWENEIQAYEESLNVKLEKFKIYINIGVILFKLGKINDSIFAFKKSIENNPNFSLAYNNLAISFLELGMFEEASEYFALALKLNKNDLSAQKHLINIFNLVCPINHKENNIINLNFEIKKLTNNLYISNYYTTENIKKILKECQNLISNSEENILFNETQIFRKNSKNLNCFRHFKVFNEFNIIPKYCFGCYKIQINLFTIIDLVKLYFIFDIIRLKNNNLRKCMIETRNQITGNYKGYIYCTGIDEANNLVKTMNVEMKKVNLNDFKISIKHGCSEFYKSYPEFKNIDNKMKYKEEWLIKEKLIDDRIPIRNEKDKKIWGEYLQGLNLSDILIIFNWINYAHLIGDLSYKKIYEKEIKPNFLNEVLESQIEYRKNIFNNKLC
tara:strand:- start:243 stop:1520 length:1278 start_codon:yes stop_codon:yes gene_type:complete